MPGDSRLIGSGVPQDMRSMPIGGGSLIPSTQGLVGGVANTNNPFIQTEVPAQLEQTKKGKKKNKTSKMTNLKSGPGLKNTAIPEIDKDGNVIKTRNRNLVNAEGEELEKNVLEQDMQEKICDLCQRPRPIFVVDTDDMIKRLPERFLSPLLKSLKKDFNNKR